MTPIILASSSSYRTELLRKLQIDFSACPSHIDETPWPNEAVEALVIRLSIAKAQAIRSQYPDHLIIGSDQAAVCGTTLLGKPGNRDNAVRQLTQQSGQAVIFYTGLCVLDSRSGRYLTDIDRCEVHFRTLSAEQIQRYVDADQPYYCAGSFKAEGLGIALFEKIVGEDPNALIGLPLIKLIKLLTQFGREIP